VADRSGPRFPVMTIRDNVEASHRLLTEELKITHVRAIIGYSMGAQQAFPWAVSYPGFADRIVATSGTAKTYPHGVVRLEGQIAAIGGAGILEIVEDHAGDTYRAVYTVRLARRIYYET
jgi:homoserine acetyltransferase